MEYEEVGTMKTAAIVFGVLAFGLTALIAGLADRNNKREQERKKKAKRKIRPKSKRKPKSQGTPVFQSVKTNPQIRGICRITGRSKTACTCNKCKKRQL